jgi:hypothetical protein
MIAPFEASKLKIERAAKHLQELEIAISAYLAEKPCVIVVEQFPGLEQMGTQAWNARIRKPMPLVLSAIIGDIVHNLRTALDLLICDLVKVNGKNPKEVYFPFCASAADLPHTIKKRNIQRAGADVVRVIESLKPYNGGNIALRAIHDLDITDKHHTLLPILSAASVPLREILGPNIPDTVANFSAVVGKDGQMMVGIPNYLKVPLGTEIPARFFLILDFGPGIGNRPVIEGLHELAKEANRVFLALTSLRPGATFPITS